MRWTKFLVIPVILLTACVTDFLNNLDNIGSTQWSSEWGLPIVSSSFSLKDYVEVVSDVVTITQDTDGVVVFEYTGDEIASDRAEDMIVIPDQTFNKTITFGSVEATNFPIDLTLSKSFNQDFTVDTGEADVLDSMVFKAGMLNIGISGDLPVSGQLEVIFKPITLNGNTLTRIYNWTYDPANPGQSFQENIDLRDAIIDYTKNGMTSSNFNFDVNLTINYTGNAISTANKVNINLTMSNPQFKIVYGKFAQRPFNTPRSNVNLDFLNNIEATNFFLDNPQINFLFKSSFGLPVSAGIQSLVAKNSTGDSLQFTGSIVDNPTSIASPTINQVGTYSETSIGINRDNSNIVDIISFLPTELDYQFQGTVDLQDPGIEQFVLDSSRVIGNYTLRLPLSGHVSELTSSQEFDFNGSDLDPLQKTRIILKTTNGLPITVGVDLIFLNNNGVALDTLLAGENLLAPAETDSNGLVTNPAENTIEELLTSEEIDLLKATSKIVLRSSLFTGTTGTENVKIQIGDEVKLNVFIQTAISL